MASGAELTPGRRKPRSCQRQGVLLRRGPRQSVSCRNEVRQNVRVCVPTSGRIVPCFDAALDNALHAVANSRLTAFPGSLFANRRKVAVLHGADGKTTMRSRRTLRATRPSEKAAALRRDALLAAASAGERFGFQGRRRAGARSIVQRSERSRKRGTPRVAFREGGFRRAVRPLFADGRRRNMFRQNLLCLCRSPLLPNVRPFFCSEQCSAFSAPPAEPSGRSRQSRLSNRNLKKG